MDNSRSEGSLLDEIHFLTNLISSHQSTGGAGPPSLRERSRRGYHHRRSLAKNMVYRPPPKVKGDSSASQLADSRLPTGLASGHPPGENYPSASGHRGSHHSRYRTVVSHSRRTNHPVSGTTSSTLPAGHSLPTRSGKQVKPSMPPSAAHATSQSAGEGFKFSFVVKTEPLSPAPAPSTSGLFSSAGQKLPGSTLAERPAARRVVIGTGRKAKAKSHAHSETKQWNGPDIGSSSRPASNRVVVNLAAPALSSPIAPPTSQHQTFAVPLKKLITPNNQAPQGQTTPDNHPPPRTSRSRRRFRRRGSKFKWKAGSTQSPSIFKPPKLAGNALKLTPAGSKPTPKLANNALKFVRTTPAGSKPTPQLAGNIVKLVGSPKGTSTPLEANAVQSTRKRRRRSKGNRLSAKKRANRVWIRPSSPAVGNPPVPPHNPAVMETDVVFISPETLVSCTPAKPVDQGGPDKLAEPIRLRGHEWKTRQGNKQWIGAGASVVARRVEPDRTGKLVEQDKTQAQPFEYLSKPVDRNRPVKLPTVTVNQPVESVVADSKSAEAVGLLGHEKKTRQGNKQWVTARSHPSRHKLVSRDSLVQPVQLVGHEKKTRQGNKQWVVGSRPARRSSVGKPVGLVGHEKKTKRGNKQWVMAGHTPKRRLSRRLSTRSRHRQSSLISFNGGKYTMDHTKRRLKRLSTSSSALLMSPAISGYLGGMASGSVKRIKASRVVKRSKAFVWHARMKKRKEKSEQFCLFFNRFGKCNKGKDCSYIHDPDKIAVCTRFLRGNCDKVDGTCPFSHKISKEKMPVCSFFLRGVCYREDCPYLHVSVGRDAKVCPDFLKGYCSRGEKCTMQHTLDCPKFSQTGSCPDGSKCPLRHAKKRKELPALTLVKEPRAFKKIRCKRELLAQGEPSGSEEAVRTESCEGEGGGGGGSEQPPITSTELDFIPLELGAAPDFIPL